MKMPLRVINRLGVGLGIGAVIEPSFTKRADDILPATFAVLQRPHPAFAETTLPKICEMVFALQDVAFINPFKRENDELIDQILRPS